VLQFGGAARRFVAKGAGVVVYNDIGGESTVRRILGDE
jgi:hypothetical protein